MYDYMKHYKEYKNHHHKLTSDEKKILKQFTLYASTLNTPIKEWKQLLSETQPLREKYQETLLDYITYTEEHN